MPWGISWSHHFKWVLYSLLGDNHTTLLVLWKSARQLFVMLLSQEKAELQLVQRSTIIAVEYWGVLYWSIMKAVQLISTRVTVRCLHLFKNTNSPTVRCTRSWSTLLAKTVYSQRTHWTISHYGNKIQISNILLISIGASTLLIHWALSVFD